MVVMAERWFWEMIRHNISPNWEKIEEWQRFLQSVKIRRFMAAMKSGDITAVTMYAGSNAQVQQDRDNGQIDLEGMSDAKTPRFVEQKA